MPDAEMCHAVVSSLRLRSTYDSRKALRSFLSHHSTQRCFTAAPFGKQDRRPQMPLVPNAARQLFLSHAYPRTPVMLVLGEA